MARIKITPELIEGIVVRVPEGFIGFSTLAERVRVDKKARTSLERAVQSGKVARWGEFFFDTARLTLEDVIALSSWCRPEFPPMEPDRSFPEAPIVERRTERDQQLAKINEPGLRALMDRMAETEGYAELHTLNEAPGGSSALQTLIQLGMLRQTGDLIYDPLRLSKRSVKNVAERLALAPLHEETLRWLSEHSGQVAQQADAIERVGGLQVWKQLVKLGGIEVFERSYRTGMPIHWVRRADGDREEADLVVRRALRLMKREADKQEDERWGEFEAQVGDVLRPGARDSQRARARVLARTYTPDRAAQRLGVRLNTLLDAVQAGKLTMFRDPDGALRIPAAQIEAAMEDVEQREAIAAYELIKVKPIAIAAGVSPSAVRGRLKRLGLSTTRPRWGEIRGQWNLPDTFAEFRRLVKEKSAEWFQQRLVAIQAADEKRRELWQAQQERERQEREVLRAKLVAAFPAWRHEGRAYQRITLHVGPTNSGKTYDALLRLGEVGEGWYLAPLRLLAFEVFDTLNARGVLCNLLTGEERIDVPGARITAATVEMFNPHQSGQCVLIDEAHLLADPDRGWAWTRALMGAEAPEIQVIGAPTARSLVERLARAAAVEIEVVEHERLTPLRVADQPWPLNHLPPRTILVAFSRASVLALKVFLEQRGRRVSVVYGNLPPEVRRRQAERFAAGETEICVATDAVGMGLNLPADQVCFAEIQKFDGREQRLLNPEEVRQIGGRAGRYLMSSVGEIGATNQEDLDLIRELFALTPQPLTHARVAPTVEDIAMIPGHLAERLEKWAMLGSIPDSLRGAIKTADMTERTELAAMLSQEEVDMLGLAAAMRLVNAPTQQNTRTYWRYCATAILYGEPMPLPPSLRAQIRDHEDLEWAEMCIRSADIYLWLSSRREFARFGPDAPHVRTLRAEWSKWIDEALVRRVDAGPRCRYCNRRLPVGHRYKVCNECFHSRRGYGW